MGKKQFRTPVREGGRLARSRHTAATSVAPGYFRREQRDDMEATLASSRTVTKTNTDLVVALPPSPNLCANL
jgi:3',5'-cyclic AMP phosphodiesterase CpdA